MSLDNIELPAFILQDLFKNSLVHLDGRENIPSSKPGSSLNFLGGNRSKITILVENASVTFLSDQELLFLTGILSACKFTLEDIGLVNLYKTPAINYQQILEQLAPKKILMLGVSPKIINLPFDIPLFQVQKFDGCIYLCAPTLAELENDRNAKKQLWLKLQEIFEI